MNKWDGYDAYKSVDVFWTELSLTLLALTILDKFHKLYVEIFNFVIIKRSICHDFTNDIFFY